MRLKRLRTRLIFLREATRILLLPLLQNALATAVNCIIIAKAEAKLLQLRIRWQPILMSGNQIIY
jgi:hypothetical protein